MSELDMPEIWYQQDGDGVEECLSIERNGPKRWYRIWRPGLDTEAREWGHRLHETAVRLVPVIFEPELDDRRQRAREAAWDMDANATGNERLEAAIETATRVRVTPEMITSACAASGLYENMYGKPMKEALAAALRTAGFEVEG